MPKLPPTEKTHCLLLENTQYPPDLGCNEIKFDNLFPQGVSGENNVNNCKDFFQLHLHINI